MGPEEQAAPLELTIELTRAEDGGDPHAFQRGSQTYYRREAGGGVREAKLVWDDALDDELRGAQSTPRSPTAAAKLGRRVGDFLRATRWPEAELAQAIEAKRPIRITIRSAAAELYSLPWELLSLDASGVRLGRLPDCLIRYEWPETKTTPLTKQAEDGRILYAWSNAGDRVPTELHRKAMASACEGRLPFDPDADVLGDRSSLSYRSLAAKLDEARRDKRGPFSVLHILCHGARLADTSAYGLVWGKEFEKEIIDGQALGELLGQHASTLRLVVLSACQSGDAGEPGSYLGGVAQSLHRAGIEAVVASRFPLSVEGSALFAKIFYERLLAEPASVEQAFLAARHELGLEPRLADDVSLQLYARAADGHDTRPIVVRPYRGLSAFRESDRRFFFGRDAEIAETVSDMIGLVDQNQPRFLVIAGASGTGKSSMVFAGVVPELRRLGWTVLAPIRPGADPMGELAKVRAELAATVARLPAEERRCLLVVDQLEELFTHVDARSPSAREQRDAFVRELWALASASDPTVAVLTAMRVDMIGRTGEIVLDSERGLRLDKHVVYREQHRTLIAQMEMAQLREAAAMPAKKVGLSLQEGLVDRMLVDVGREPGALPLLQFTLDKLWERRCGRELTQAAYDELGGIAGAVATSADQVLQALDDDAKKAARRLFVRLVSVRDDAALDTRRRVLLDDLRPQGADAEVFEQVLQRFLEARLLVCDEGLVEQESRATVEVAHEALIRSWGTLRGWVNEQRRMLSDFDKLRAWAAEKKREEGFLLMGSQLARARGMVAAYGDEIAADPSLVAARALIEASEAESERAALEREAQRQRELAQAQRAREHALVAGAREIFARGEPWWAMKVLAESDQPGLARGWEQLARELLVSPWLLRATLRGHTGPVLFVAASPDGLRIVTTSDDGTARVWSADGSGEPVILGDHKNWVVSADFSADSRSVLTGCLDGKTRLWDLEHPEGPTILRGHESGMHFAALDPRGERLVAACGDGNARVLRLDGSGEPIVLRAHEGPIRSAMFSADGARVLTCEDQTARVWNADGSGTPVALKHDHFVVSAVFSANGLRVVTACGGRTARIWNADGSGEPVILQGHENEVRWAAFGPGDEYVITASDDGTARLWHCDGGVEFMQLSHPPQVTCAAFSPGWTYAMTASRDGTVHVWSSISYPEETRFEVGEGVVDSAGWSPDGRQIISVSAGEAVLWNVDGSGEPELVAADASAFAAFSPDGQRIVIASQDGSARVWTAGDPAAPLLLKGPEGALKMAVFSPDGLRVAAASADGSVRLWSANGSGPPILWKEHEGAVNAVAFDPGGQRLGSAGRDGTVRLWNIDGSGKPLVLKGDGGSVTAIAFSPDGRRVVSTWTDGTLRLWSADGSGEPTILRQNGMALSAAWSPDGQRFATGAYPSTACLWITDGSDEPVALQGHDGEITCISFSPDGQRILTASADGTARIWTLSLTDLLRNLREITSLCLPPSFRRTYLGETAEEAQARYEACERSHGRTPRRE